MGAGLVNALQRPIGETSRAMSTAGLTYAIISKYYEPSV